jgi:hypothetical protein
MEAMEQCDGSEAVEAMEVQEAKVAKRTAIYHRAALLFP